MKILKRVIAAFVAVFLMLGSFALAVELSLSWATLITPAFARASTHLSFYSIAVIPRGSGNIEVTKGAGYA